MNHQLSRWFSRREFACRCGCGFDSIDAELLQVLNLARVFFENPIYITSGCRCPSYNSSIGGASKSMHIWSRAADITVANINPTDVQKFFLEIYHNKYGIGCYQTFTHIDTRTNGPTRWEG